LVLQAGGKAFCIVRESLLFSGRSNSHAGRCVK
jgi:hypothetical protein